jgi:transposase
MPKAFPKEFREDMIRVYRDSDASLAQVAKDFGISPSCLKRWVTIDDRTSAISLPTGQAVNESNSLREANKRIKRVTPWSTSQYRGYGPGRRLRLASKRPHIPLSDCSVTTARHLGRLASVRRETDRMASLGRVRVWHDAEAGSHRLRGDPGRMLGALLIRSRDGLQDTGNEVGGAVRLPGCPTGRLLVPGSRGRPIDETLIRTGHEVSGPSSAYRSALRFAFDDEDEGGAS